MHPPWEDAVPGLEHMPLTVRKGIWCPKKIQLQPTLLDSDTIIADEDFSGESYILKKVNKNPCELSVRMKYKVRVFKIVQQNGHKVTIWHCCSATEVENTKHFLTITIFL